MRNLFIILLTLLPFTVFAQLDNGPFHYPTDSVDHRITYKGIENVSGTKTQLYNRAKEWFARNFHSGKDVIQLDDPINGKLIGRGIIVVNTLFRTETDLLEKNNNVWFTVSINVKDGKYRYIFEDYNVDYHNEGKEENLEELLLYLVKHEDSNSESLSFWLGPGSKTLKLIESLHQEMVKKDDF